MLSISTTDLCGAETDRSEVRDSWIRQAKNAVDRIDRERAGQRGDRREVLVGRGEASDSH